MSSKKSKTTSEPKPTPPPAPVPIQDQDPPTKAQILAFVEANFISSSSLANTPKNPDPVVDLYNYDPKSFPFAQDNGKAFKLNLIPADATTATTKVEKAALASLLQIHSTWIRFTPPYNGKSRIYCTLTKKEIVPTYTTLREYFAAQLFGRAWASKVGKSLDPRLAQKLQEAKAAKAESKRKQVNAGADDEEAVKTTKKAKNASSNKADDDQLVQLGYSDDELPMNRNGAQALAPAYSDDETPNDPAATENEDGFKKRYIVFVGNLDYYTSKKDLQKLFEKCDILDIRLSSNKMTKQSNGYAFVEFKTASNVHHALGYDLSELRGRKINVELTAAGGGNSKKRRQKIEQKRVKVSQEKAQRFELDTSRYIARRNEQKQQQQQQ